MMTVFSGQPALETLSGAFQMNLFITFMCLSSLLTGGQQILRNPGKVEKVRSLIVSMKKSCTEADE